MDIGTGGGFPGVVMKFFWPQANITLLEKSSKKLSFLKFVSEKIKLKKIIFTNNFFYNIKKINFFIIRAVLIEKKYLYLIKNLDHNYKIFNFSGNFQTFSTWFYY